LIYRTGYIWFSPFNHLLLRANVHARFIQLLNCMIIVFPFYLYIFLLCTQFVYTHQELCSIATLEFRWNFSGILHILAHVAWIVDISMDTYHTD